MGEGAEVPPFLPALALPPAELEAASWLSSRGRQDAVPGMRLCPNPPGPGLGHLSRSCSSGEEGVGGRPQTRLWAQVAERERGIGTHLTAGQGDPLGSQDMAIGLEDLALYPMPRVQILLFIAPLGAWAGHLISAVCCRPMTMLSLRCPPPNPHQ
jgi:hypothetical protein